MVTISILLSVLISFIKNMDIWRLFFTQFKIMSFYCIKIISIKDKNIYKRIKEKLYRKK